MARCRTRVAGRGARFRRPGLRRSVMESHLSDAEIAELLEQRGLEMAYLRELAATLGFHTAEGWSDELIEAIDSASAQQRRRAALRTIDLSDSTA